MSPLPEEAAGAGRVRVPQAALWSFRAVSGPDRDVRPARAQWAPFSSQAAHSMGPRSSRQRSSQQALWTVLKATEPVAAQGGR